MKVIVAAGDIGFNVSSELFSFFTSRFCVRVAGKAAQDQATLLHGLPSHSSFCLGKVPSYSIQDP